MSAWPRFSESGRAQLARRIEAAAPRFIEPRPPSHVSLDSRPQRFRGWHDMPGRAPRPHSKLDVGRLTLNVPIHVSVASILRIGEGDACAVWQVAMPLRSLPISHYPSGLRHRPEADFNIYETTLFLVARNAPFLVVWAREIMLL